MSAVWIVDDDQSIRFVLEKALTREGLCIRSFTAAKDVLHALEGMSEQDYPQLLISDIRMSGLSGIELLSRMRDLYSNIPIIIMTAYSDLDSTVSAFQGGAYEYITKPFDLTVMVDLVKRALDEVRYRVQDQDFLHVNDLSALPNGLIGQGAAMQEVFRSIGRLSQSDVTVLITGESGTGKELVAQALHKHSPRSVGPFVAINTAAISKDLLESELFGHEKGAFTGAVSQRLGRFEQAQGGTLFLDEIGDMSFDLQTRLLRVLSEDRFYRVGGKEAIQADVRVIAATHQNLEEMVKQGTFREDLFHRLNVIRLRLPSLRERTEDIPLLVRHFLSMSARHQGNEMKMLSEQAMDVLMHFPYPGNVRQLENFCHWLNVMVPAQLIQVQDLPKELAFATLTSSHSNPKYDEEKQEVSSLTQNKAFQAATEDKKYLYPDKLDRQSNCFDEVQLTWELLLKQELREMLGQKTNKNVWDDLSRRFESCMISTALDETGGKRIEAANRLGIGRNTITRKIQDLKLDH